MTSNYNLLQHIQILQFQKKDEAESLLLAFLREVYSSDVASVELRPLAVSLNSFNGFLTLTNGDRFFFKTHTEADTLIDEYYNASQLADAGYPIIRPVFSSTEVGKQLLVYDVINSESVFDVAWAIENGDNSHADSLLQAQNRSDDDLLRLYLRSLEFQSAGSALLSPIHQLFSHRLTGGRLDRFYGTGTQIALPTGVHLLNEVRAAKWVINGQVYYETLDNIIEQATNLLRPAQSGMSIVGHGDAHNGNVFFQEENCPPSLVYFDPAFAGRHHPLLDITKPLFHNVFAMWMYYPHEKHLSTQISLKIQDDHWVVDYNYPLHPVRDMFLHSKLHRVLIPVLKEMKLRGNLRPDWRKYLKSSLFCCPFLTMNLADSKKFSPEIALLGLAMSIEMGAESHVDRSTIDRILDETSDHVA